MTWATPGDADKLDKVLEAFSNYFKPKVNEIYERFTFLQRRQQQGETFDSFYTDLLRLVESCGYHQDERRKIIRDQIGMNITSDAVREKLLAEAALTLEKAADMCRSMEATTHYLNTMSATATSGRECESETALAHAVRRKSGKCQYCAQHHKPRSCPAWGKQCTYCGKMNHLEEACKTAERERRLNSQKQTAANQDTNAGRENTKLGTQRQPSQVTSSKRETANAVSPDRGYTQQTDDDDGDTDHFAYTVVSRKSRPPNTGTKEWNIILDIGGRGLKTKVDTGSTCNIMPIRAYNVLQSGPPKPTNTQLTAYGGAKLDVRGKTVQDVSFNGKTRPTEFIVVQEDVQTLLGLPSIREFGLLQETLAVNSKMNLPQDMGKYQDVFQGLEQLPGQYTIKLRNDAQPAIQPARRVPFKYREQLQEQLKEMEENGIIAPVTEATDWVSPIVLVNKPGKEKLRICIDPGALNQAIQREHYQIRTPEEIFGSLTGAKYFTTLDATSGFLQLKLDEPSSYLTTIATPFGRYRYLRLPFGICSAPEVFHRTVTEAFSDIPGVHTYIDDILVAGSTEDEHDTRLRAVLDRCRQLNLKLNLSKCQFKKSELKYLGHILTSEGIKPDPDKVDSISHFPTPTTKSEVS